jgi:small subunit ribosomal protein S18
MNLENVAVQENEVVAPEAENTVEAPAAPAEEGVKKPYRSGNMNNRRKKKVCLFCTDKTATIDYKEAGKLRKFTSERGKILPRRVTGTCAMHQREVTRAIKLARVVALLPYTTD